MSVKLLYLPKNFHTSQNKFLAMSLTLAKLCSAGDNDKSCELDSVHMLLSTDIWTAALVCLGGVNDVTLLPFSSQCSLCRSTPVTIYSTTTLQWHQTCTAQPSKPDIETRKLVGDRKHRQARARIWWTQNIIFFHDVIKHVYQPNVVKCDFVCLGLLHCYVAVKATYIRLLFGKMGFFWP